MKGTKGSMSGKRSLLDYFKKAGGPPKPEEVVEVELVEDDEEEIEAEAVVTEDDQVQEVEVEELEVAEEVVEETNGRRRSTRASANRAREAWNGHEPSISTSEDEDDDLPRSARKRKTRSSIQNSSKRNKQTTLSANGKIINNKENNNAKKKPKYDPEREAFLRSGVPDVIEKLKAKPKSSVITLDDDEEEEDEKASEKEKRRTLDPATLAFLHSGLPESIKKAQQTVEKRKEENELLVNMGFFPKISHTSSPLKGDGDADATPSSSETNDEIEIACKFNIKSSSQNQSDIELALGVSEEGLEFSFTSSSQPGFTCLSSQENDLFHPVGLCCDDNSVRVSSQQEERKTRRGAEKEEKEKDFRPWIETSKVNNVKDLLVDTAGLETLTKWLKQWRSDIKDDGGTSRKLEKKRKRGNSSDSDFITSDEEDSEMKKKSVLLTGPSGSGKTSAVYVLADHYQFKVVEVNFSSRRSGKEVLQRVEEAVLSHRVTSSLNCLLLFKDIDLFHPEEDEGFYSAVAQLITTAVRPIVMTSSLPEYFSIDSKLDRKDPLRIAFNFRKPRDIVERILKPILAATKSNVESDSMADVDLWLDSIVRHSGCDVRRCINQLQLLLSTSTGSLKPRLLSNQDIHLYSNPFLPHSVDLNFPRQSLASECNSVDTVSSQEEDDEVNLSLSARKKLCHSQLEKLSQNLEIFADLDWISRTPSSISTLNANMFGDIDEATWRWRHGSSFRSPFFTRLSLVSGDSKRKDKDMKWAKKLVLETDAEIDKWMKIDGLNSDIGQYCGSDLGSAEWESYAAVRTIVKNNKLESTIGRMQKRHGRMASYFNRLEKGLVDRISNSFDFKSQLDSIKVYPDFD